MNIIPGQRHSVAMNAIAQWSEGTRNTVMRAGIAGVAALALILVFAIYVRFFPTPISFLVGGPTEHFAAATLERPATGTSRQQRLTK